MQTLSLFYIRNSTMYCINQNITKTKWIDKAKVDFELVALLKPRLYLVFTFVRYQSDIIFFSWYPENLVY